MGLYRSWRAFLFIGALVWSLPFLMPAQAAADAEFAEFAELPSTYEAYEIENFMAEGRSFLESCDLICSICCNACKTPKGDPSHRHLFCSHCLDRVIAGSASRGNFPCPLCRSSIQNAAIKENHYAKSLVEKAKTQCRYRLKRRDDGNLVALPEDENACSWTGALSDLDGHTEKCGFRYIKCSDCAAEMRQKDWQAHREAGCERHYPCEFVKYGCPQNRLTRSELATHLAEKTTQHLELVLARCQRYETESETRGPLGGLLFEGREYVLAKDSWNLWYPAYIMDGTDTSGRRRFRFVGWDTSLDEWIQEKSPRIAHFKDFSELDVQLEKIPKIGRRTRPEEVNELRTRLQTVLSRHSRASGQTGP